jgi:hypothetical protein
MVSVYKDIKAAALAGAIVTQAEFDAYVLQNEATRAFVSVMSVTSTAELVTFLSSETNKTAFYATLDDENFVSAIASNATVCDAIIGDTVGRTILLTTPHTYALWDGVAFQDSLASWINVNYETAIVYTASNYWGYEIPIDFTIATGVSFFMRGTCTGATVDNTIVRTLPSATTPYNLTDQTAWYYRTPVAIPSTDTSIIFYVEAVGSGGLDPSAYDMVFGNIEQGTGPVTSGQRVMILTQSDPSPSAGCHNQLYGLAFNRR